MQELIEKMLASIRKNYEDCNSLEEYAESCAKIAYEHFNQWVDIADRLPEDVYKVYFLTSIFPIVYEGRFLEQCEGFNNPHFISDSGVRYSVEQVSHWMDNKLPEPPKNI